MSTNMLIFLQKIISVLILFFFASFCYNYFILRALRIAQIWFELHFCCTGALFWTLTRTKSSRVSFGICSLFKISQLSPLTTRLHQPKIYAISWLVRTSTRTFLRPFTGVLKIGKTKNTMFPVRITNAKMRHFFFSFPPIWLCFVMFS